MSESSPFSADYFAARDRFRRASRSVDARLESCPIGTHPATSEDLTIDVAVIGPEQPTRTILVTSGLHGVEGFFGSAVQIELLEGGMFRKKLPAGTSITLVHALNPFGFASLRRFDEDNVDLNRNFLLDGEEFAGCPKAYPELNGLINPQRPPTRFDPFRLQIVPVILWRGMGPLREAIAGGQYEYPLGLFFGGKSPSRISKILRSNLPQWISGAGRIQHVDFHTGHGTPKDYRLLMVKAMNGHTERFVRLFGPNRLQTLSS